MQIMINGDKHDVSGPGISHEQICALAKQPVYATVTYVGPRRGDSERSGATYAGKSGTVEDGMIFSCIPTGNA